MPPRGFRLKAKQQRKPHWVFWLEGGHTMIPAPAACRLPHSLTFLPLNGKPTMWKTLGREVKMSKIYRFSLKDTTSNGWITKAM